MSTKTLTDTEYTQFYRLILTRTGLDFPPHRRDDLAIWLWRALDTLQDSVRYQPGIYAAAVPSTMRELYNALLAEHELTWNTVIDALTVCETHFFRNAPQFEVLREQILPQLIALRRQQGNRSLRLWSAGCASGEEAYSLAILLQEILPDWKAWQIKILGTDINAHSLQQARHGAYRDWSFREAYAQQIRDHYFDDIDRRYHVHNDVRQMVSFEQCSLADRCGIAGSDEPAMDIIMCRNVILYLGHQIRGWVYQQLKQALLPGGWLFVGHADPSPPNYTAFDALNYSGVTIYRKPQTASLPPEPRQEWTLDLDNTEPLVIPAPPPIPKNANWTEAETQYRLGNWHANRQHWKEALHHCEEATTLVPTYTEVYYTLGLINQSMGDNEAAIEALRRAIYLERNWSLPRFTLAGIYREVGRIEQARRELRNVIDITLSLPPDTAVKLSDGLTAARLHDVAARQLNLLNELSGYSQ